MNFGVNAHSEFLNVGSSSSLSWSRQNGRCYFTVTATAYFVSLLMVAVDAISSLLSAHDLL